MAGMPNNPCAKVLTVHGVLHARSCDAFRQRCHVGVQLERMPACRGCARLSCPTASPSLLASQHDLPRSPSCARSAHILQPLNRPARALAWTHALAAAPSPGPRAGPRSVPASCSGRSAMMRCLYIDCFHLYESLHHAKPEKVLHSSRGQDPMSRRGAPQALTRSFVLTAVRADELQ